MSTTIKFNIGLKASTTGLTIDAGLALKQLFAYLAEPVTSLRTLKIAQSSTEPTLVVAVQTTENVRELEKRIFALSESLDQECIAWKAAGSDHGALTGPGAHKWVPFNNQYFIE